MSSWQMLHIMQQFLRLTNYYVLLLDDYWCKIKSIMSKKTLQTMICSNFQTFLLQNVGSRTIEAIYHIPFCATNIWHYLIKKQLIVILNRSFGYVGESDWGHVFHIRHYSILPSPDASGRWIHIVWRILKIRNCWIKRMNQIIYIEWGILNKNRKCWNKKIIDGWLIKEKTSSDSIFMDTTLTQHYAYKRIFIILLNSQMYSSTAQPILKVSCFLHTFTIKFYSHACSRYSGYQLDGTQFYWNS